MTETDRAAIPNGPWLRRSRRIAYENPWITVWHDEVSRPDGSPGIYGLVHFANLAAGVVVLDEDDRVLLVGQHRYTLGEPSWEIPEGGVPAGETPIDGIRRELREETGVEASEWRELVRIHLSNSVTDEAGVVYLARGLSHGTSQPEPTEQIEVRWVPFEEALVMAADGRITDAMSLIGLQRVALERAWRTES
jgi:8-oxo-dGTP pyrophosphatase MutT (NUDIX family)